MAFLFYKIRDKKAIRGPRLPRVFANRSGVFARGSVERLRTGLFAYYSAVYVSTTVLSGREAALQRWRVTRRNVATDEEGQTKNPKSQLPHQQSRSLAPFHYTDLRPPTTALVHTFEAHVANYLHFTTWSKSELQQRRVISVRTWGHQTAPTSCLRTSAWLVDGCRRPLPERRMRHRTPSRIYSNETQGMTLVGLKRKEPISH